MNTNDAIYDGTTGFAFDVIVHDSIGLGSLGFVFGGVDASVKNDNGKLVVRCEVDDYDDIRDVAAIAEQIIKSLKDHYVRGELVSQKQSKRAEPRQIETISGDMDPMERWALEKDDGCW